MIGSHKREEGYYKIWFVIMALQRSGNVVFVAIFIALMVVSSPDVMLTSSHAAGLAKIGDQIATILILL